MRSLLLTLLALAGATPAAAQTTKVAPPGNSGVNEYLETVPTAGGGEPSSTHGSGGGASLPASVRSALAKQGPDGRAALSTAEAGAPGAGKGGHAPAKLSPQDVHEPSGQNLPSAIAHALGGSDSGGMGIWLPILLIGSALAIAAAAVAKRRSSA